MDALSVNSGGTGSRHSVQVSSKGVVVMKPPLMNSRDSKIENHLKTLDNYTKNPKI